MQKSSFYNLVERAKKREQGSVNFYTHCAKRAKDPLTKDFFFDLVEEEKRHVKNLEHVRFSKVKRFSEHKIEDLKLSDFLVEMKMDDNMTLQDAMIFAIKLEQHAADFYAKLADATDDPDAKKIFNSFQEEEIKHKKSLEEAYEDSAYQFF
ncbi:ferritin family protein [Thermodesulfobacteriota bacterium]